MFTRGAGRGATGRRFWRWAIQMPAMSHPLIGYNMDIKQIRIVIVEVQNLVSHRNIPKWYNQIYEYT